MEQALTHSIPSTPTWQRALSTTAQVNSCAASADGSRVVAAFAIAGSASGTVTLAYGAGHFYLFDNVASQVMWACPTSKMNWPMAIAASGRAIVGASDDGCVYYWARA